MLDALAKRGGSECFRHDELDHFGPTMTVPRAGIATLAEKPLVFDLDEADALRAEAQLEVTGTAGPHARSVPPPTLEALRAGEPPPVPATAGRRASVLALAAVKPLCTIFTRTLPYEP